MRSSAIGGIYNIYEYVKKNNEFQQDKFFVSKGMFQDLEYGY
jgi:hypothetical protein